MSRDTKPMTRERFRQEAALGLANGAMSNSFWDYSNITSKPDDAKEALCRIISAASALTDAMFGPEDEQVQYTNGEWSREVAPVARDEDALIERITDAVSNVLHIQANKGVGCESTDEYLDRNYGHWNPQDAIRKAVTRAVKGGER